MAHAGGFIAPTADLVALPDISIYADGTVIVPGPQIERFPPPALPSIVVQAVDPAGLATILDTAKATGLGDPNAAFDGGPAPDAGVTLITVDLGGSVRHLRILSLGENGRDQGLDPAVAAARVKLRAFLAALGDLPTLVGANHVGAQAQYVADSTMLLVTPGAPASDSSSGPAVDWPLSTPLASFGAPLAVGGSAGGGTNGAGGLAGGGTNPGADEPVTRCGTVSGTDLATLTPSLTSATTMTAWTSAGMPFTLVARPLLPDEVGCPGS